MRLSLTLVDGNCTACENGWFKEYKYIGSCTSCDAEVIEGAFNSYPGVSRSSKDSCACGRGSFRDYNHYGPRPYRCQSCEDPEIGLNKNNVDCKRIGLTVETLPVRNDFWRSSNRTYKIVECEHHEYCDGYNSDSNCAEGHKGALCSVCIDGYSKWYIGISEVTMCRDDGYLSDRFSTGFYTLCGLLSLLTYLLSLLQSLLQKSRPRHVKSQIVESSIKLGEEAQNKSQDSGLILSVRLDFPHTSQDQLSKDIYSFMLRYIQRV